MHDLTKTVPRDQRHGLRVRVRDSFPMIISGVIAREWLWLVGCLALPLIIFAVTNTADNVNAPKTPEKDFWTDLLFPYCFVQLIRASKWAVKTMHRD